MTIERIDPEQLLDNPYQPRSTYPRSKIDEIAYSINQVGIIHIPKARQVNGHYELVEGHLRKRAYLKLKKQYPKKYPDMPIDVQEFTDDQMAIIALEENLRRQDITPLDQARAIDIYLATFTEKTETGLAKTLNMTQGNVSNMRRVLKCPDEVLQKIVDGKINFTMARELLVFQGIQVGFDTKYGGGKEVKVPMDEQWLMLEAVRKVGGQYGIAATVDGIKKAIFQVSESHLRWLERGQSYWGQARQPLFDIRKANCLKCPKMVRANETKSQVRHFCSDLECWDQKQDSHKKKMAASAQKKRDADIAQRIAETEAHNAVVTEVKGAPPDVPENPAESTIGIPVLDTTEEVLEEHTEEEKGESAIAAAPIFDTIDEVCKGCVGRKDCARTGVCAAQDVKGYYCLDRVTKDNYQDIREKAKAVVPDSIKELVKNRAGTRAEIVDIRDMRLSTRGDDMKAGFNLLDAHVYDGWRDTAQTVLDRIEDPKECLERCTKGFHYGYDSGDDTAKVRNVCSDPKCLAKKKAAFTRVVNAKGQAKKKAEATAIKEAVDKTTALGHGHMRLVIQVILFKDPNYYQDDSDNIVASLAKKLKVEPVKNKYGSGVDSEETTKVIVKALEKASDDELAKMITEACLRKLTYTGEIANYKIYTTDPLKWLGVNVPNIPQKGLIVEALLSDG